MSNPHTDDTFMYENKLMANLESAYDAHSKQDSVTLTDPLVWRITHQRGPAVSRKAAADALRGIDPDVLNEEAAAEIDADAWGRYQDMHDQEQDERIHQIADRLVREEIEKKVLKQKTLAEMENKSVNPSDYVDWTQAPEWATAWAMDDDGCAFWFECEPTLYEDKYGAVWGDDEHGVTEGAPDFFFPVSRFRKSFCTRDTDENAFDQMTLAEKMGAEDYALDEATEKAFMDALDRADNVHSPSHYNSGNIECIDAIEEALTEEEMRGYFKANCIKYLWRERYKNGLEDLRKAHWYLSRLIDNLED